MSEDEKNARFQEEQFPAKVSAAFAEARARALASGQSVVESKDGFLYEVFPDGRRVQLRPIEPSRSVTLGQKIRIR